MSVGAALLANGESGGTGPVSAVNSPYLAVSCVNRPRGFEGLLLVKLITDEENEHDRVRC